MVLSHQSSVATSAPLVSSDTALLIIDMINPPQLSAGRGTLSSAYDAAVRIHKLKQGADQARIPVIYINDNFGTWRQDFPALVRKCIDEPCRGKVIAKLLAPLGNEYFVLKPKHSAFFATPLELLLQSLHVKRRILTGVTGDQCILYTAADAYMREYGLLIPADCTASVTSRKNDQALEHMRTYFDANTCESGQLFPEDSTATVPKIASPK